MVEESGKEIKIWESFINYLLVSVDTIEMNVDSNKKKLKVRDTWVAQ